MKNLIWKLSIIGILIAGSAVNASATQHHGECNWRSDVSRTLDILSERYDTHYHSSNTSNVKVEQVAWRTNSAKFLNESSERYNEMPSHDTMRAQMNIIKLSESSPSFRRGVAETLDFLSERY